MTVLAKERTYIIDDIVISLPEEKCEELMDGYYPGFVFDLIPSTMHQWFVSRLQAHIGSQITKSGKDYVVISAKTGLALDYESHIEPDLSIICDKKKLSDYDCEKAPDWVIVVSNSSTQNDDYTTKLFEYRSIGIRLYWVVNLENKTVNVWNFEHGEYAQYSFSDSIPVAVCNNIKVCLDDIM